MTRTWSIEEFLRTLARITRPPREAACIIVNPSPGHLDSCPKPHDVDGAEQLAEREAEEEVSEPGRFSIENITWGEPPLTDDELVGVRGLLQERYEPESVADYMARAERVESGYIIRDSAEMDRLAELAIDAYTSAPTAADDPAGVDSNPPESPPAGLAAWLEPAVWEALAGHTPYFYEARKFPIACNDDEQAHAYLPDWQGWREHVGLSIAEHIARAIGDFPGQVQ